MLFAIPLMIIPFIAYNLVIFGYLLPGGIAALDTQIFALDTLSGATWSMTAGDLFIIGGLATLFLEVLKAARGGSGSILDHILSTLVFVAFLLEFLLVPEAATNVFFALVVIAFVDVVAGFSVSIRTAQRDVAIGL